MGSPVPLQEKWLLVAPQHVGGGWALVLPGCRADRTRHVALLVPLCPAHRSPSGPFHCHGPLGGPAPSEGPPHSQGILGVLPRWLYVFQWVPIGERPGAVGGALIPQVFFCGAVVTAIFYSYPRRLPWSQGLCPRGPVGSRPGGLLWAARRLGGISIVRPQFYWYLARGQPYPAPRAGWAFLASRPDPGDLQPAEGR